MADYSQAMADLANAALICEQHAIIKPVNGIQPEYPRWANAWADAGCEKVWRYFLESQTMRSEDEEDRQIVRPSCESPQNYANNLGTSNDRATNQTHGRSVP